MDEEFRLSTEEVRMVIQVSRGYFGESQGIFVNCSSWSKESVAWRTAAYANLLKASKNGLVPSISRSLRYFWI